MSIARITRLLAVVFILLGAGLANADDERPRLLFHWDRNAGTTKAVVLSSGGEVLAESLHNGPIPRLYSSVGEEVDVPTGLLAVLRDQLDQSAQEEAAEAADFIRELMDQHAYTPIEELDVDEGIWIPYSQLDVKEWCGTSVNVYDECGSPAHSSLQTTMCKDLACKGTEIKPAASNYP